MTDDDYKEIRNLGILILSLLAAMGSIKTYEYFTSPRRQFEKSESALPPPQRKSVEQSPYYLMSGLKFTSYD